VCACCRLSVECHLQLRRLIPPKPPTIPTPTFAVEVFDTPTFRVAFTPPLVQKLREYEGDGPLDLASLRRSLNTNDDIDVDAPTKPLSFSLYQRSLIRIDRHIAQLLATVPVRSSIAPLAPPPTPPPLSRAKCVPESKRKQRCHRARPRRPHVWWRALQRQSRRRECRFEQRI
jgi:hypothetical protein